MATTPLAPLSRPEDPLRSGRSLLEGIASGAVYGVLLRGFIVLQAIAQKHLATHFTDPEASRRHFSLLRNGLIAGEIMTVAFLVLGSILIGFVTVRRIERQRPASIYTWILAPWLAVFCMMTVIALFAWEGAICVVMALPITLILSSLGGIIAGVLGRRMVLTASRTACLAILPFLLAPAESMLPGLVQTRTVASEIRIHAPAATIWQNIERVPAISTSELRPTWAHRIGFPRPIEATLSYEGVGGVRHASFEHGLLFLETVTAWEPEHRLAFSIRADSAHIPPTTLDEHVTIGGRYFDVLDGEYSLEPLANGDTLLHLTSHQRLSTNINAYAGLWTDAVMQNLQTSILQVIQHRCEHFAGG